MHAPVKDYVEEYLAGSDSLPREFTAHLAVCETCRRDIAELQEQSALLRVLRVAEEAEPSVGFYARVVDRIDSQRQFSIWSIFLEPAFGRRLAVASAVLAVMMGVYLVSSERSGAAMLVPNSQVEAAMLAGEDEPGPVLGAGQDQDRGSVLVNLVTYQEQ